MVDSINIYATKVLFFPNLSYPGRSHVLSIFTNEKHRKVGSCNWPGWSDLPADGVELEAGQDAGQTYL